MSKYARDFCKNGYTLDNVDVYDVLVAFEVSCPAMQHAIKKMLMSGQRGFKSSEEDKREAIASIERSIELGVDV